MTAAAIGRHRPAREGRRSRRDGRLHVVVADHDGFARSMMRAALTALDRVAMVTTASDGREALDLVRYYQPSILVTETSLPAGGAELIGRILEESPETRVLTVSVDDEESALAALRAGAVGHIPKNIEPDELADLVVRAAEGEAIVPQGLIKPLLELVREIPDAGWRPLRSRLTTREWEIVEHLADGASTLDIAERLVLSPTTVYSHVKSLMRKLDVHTRREAVVAAEGLRRHEAVGRKDLGRI